MHDMKTFYSCHIFTGKYLLQLPRMVSCRKFHFSLPEAKSTVNLLNCIFCLLLFSARDDILLTCKLLQRPFLNSDENLDEDKLVRLFKYFFGGYITISRFCCDKFVRQRHNIFI
jgi:hypothetical protein